LVAGAELSQVVAFMKDERERRNTERRAERRNSLGELTSSIRFPWPNVPAPPP
jgi:hypothetical protein